VQFCCDPVAVENPEELDVTRIDNPMCNLNGVAPAPAMLDQQIDTMAIKYMLRQLNVLVKGLHKRIFAKSNRQYWFEIFLTTFVLLATLEMVHHQQVHYQRAQAQAKMDGETVTRINGISYTMTEEWEHSARTLVYHFRCLIRGHLPFSLSSDFWNSNRGTAYALRAQLDADSLSFTKDMAALVTARRQELVAAHDHGIRDVLPLPLVWVSELFLGD